MKRIPVAYVKMGRHKAWGGYDEEGYPIRIDPRAKGKKHLEILIHESLHYLFPLMEEEEIIKKAVLLTNTLWGEDYRRVDGDCSTPLQDGSK